LIVKKERTRKNGELKNGEEEVGNGERILNKK
jgi:hypothetical protein